MCRGYSIKGEGDKQGCIITGVRTLGTGRTITLNSPFTNIEISDSDYPKIKMLVEGLDRCREQIMVFMDHNKSQDEIQGKLFNAAPENVILKSKDLSDLTAEEAMQMASEGKEVDVTHLYLPKEEVKPQPAEETEIERELPKHLGAMTEKELKALGTPEAVGQLQKNNAAKNLRKEKKANK